MADGYAWWGGRPPREGPSSAPAAFYSSPRATSPARTALAAALVVIGYYAGTEIGFVLTPAASPISYLWPPNALVLAALLLVPTRSWWILLVALLPTHLLVQLRNDVPLVTALGWFVTNTGEAVLGAACIRRFLGHEVPFETFRGVTVFCFFGVFLAPFVTSFLDAAVVVATGQGSDYWALWRTRLFSNCLANLTVVPAIVMIGARGQAWFQAASLRRLVEAALLSLGIIVVAALAFGQPHASASIPIFVYGPLLLLIPVAVRFGPGGVSASLLTVALVAIWHAAHGRGPFTSDSVAQHVIAVQLLLSVISVPLLALAAVLQERRRAEDALRHSEEQMGVAAESANLGFWSLDLATMQLWTTEHCRRLHGLRPDFAMTVEGFLEACHPDDAPAVGTFVKALGRRASQDVEFRVVLPDGSVRWIHDSAQPRGNGGTAGRICGVVRDVTDRRQAELEAEAQRREVTHLTRVLLLGELSGALAHELNQPLAAILSNAQAAQRFLREDPSDAAEVSQILDDIVREDRRAAEIIRRLRALMKKGETKFQSLDVNEVARDVLDSARRDFAARRITVASFLATDLPAVRGDRIQLHQVLMNLMLNACDAMAGKNAAERVLTVASGVRDGMVQITVEDRGTGIAPEHMERLLQPFFTTKEGGLGLGLTISGSIVEAHGGSLWAANNSDAGATFHVELPREGSGPR